MEAWNAMLHKLAALCNRPLAANLCHSCIVLAALNLSDKVNGKVYPEGLWQNI